MPPATSVHVPTVTDAEVLELLHIGELTVLGQLRDSSNGALLCRVAGPSTDAGVGFPQDDPSAVLAIHKPIAHERPLWDYPEGTLAEREVAAFLISEAGGFDVVPPTVLRDGPFGPGSLQHWIGPPGADEVQEVVAVTGPEDLPDGWLGVLRGEGESGEPVVVSHADDPALRTTAVFDALINNSDRKGSHLVANGRGIRGFDHGVSLSVEPKLRTVLWGWVGQELTPSDLARLTRLARQLGSGADLRGRLEQLLTAAEIDALLDRAVALIETRRHPHPEPGWPAIPWPAL